MEVGVGLLDFMRETGFGGCPLTIYFSPVIFQVYARLWTSWTKKCKTAFYLIRLFMTPVKYEKNFKEKRRERRRLRSNCREARRDRDNGMSRT